MNTDPIAPLLVAIVIVVAIMVLAALIRLALDAYRRRQSHKPTRVEWSTEFHGQAYSYRAELIGETWSLSGDNGHGAIRGTIGECQAWVMADIAGRVQRHILDYHS